MFSYKRDCNWLGAIKGMAFWSRGSSHGSLFKTWPKPETAYEKPLAPKVVFMWRTNKILISNWPRMRNVSQLLQAGKTLGFDLDFLRVLCFSFPVPLVGPSSRFFIFSATKANEKYSPQKNTQFNWIWIKTVQVTFHVAWSSLIDGTSVKPLVIG